MVWTAPKTFVSNDILTAAEMNFQVRDNLNQMMAAKATQEGSYFIASGPNTFAERHRKSQTQVTLATTTSSTYTDPTVGEAGPSVTLTTGSFVVVWLRAEVFNASAASCRMSVQVSGATPVIAPSDTYSLCLAANAGNRIQTSHMIFFDQLTPGENTFTCKYRASSGTANFPYRQLSVFAY